MTGQKEDVVLHQCLEYLRAKGFYVWRNNTGSARIGRRFIRFGYEGSADIIGILPDGRFLAVECKREIGGKLSDKQVEFLTCIAKNNGFAICVNSLADLQEKIHKIHLNNII